VLLPAGTLHGHLDLAAALGVLRAAHGGRTVLQGSRGRSTWPAAAQAAEVAVREETGILDLDALDVTEHEPTGDRSWTTAITHRDGRRWRVEVESRDSEALRAESCGKALKPMTWFTQVARLDRSASPAEARRVPE
jgi:hypothetical protein